ncbi:hypothetical protein OIU79_028699 [Salix purpurea]|uniref:Uncharacterized protein n=1 Tax=Salix purpurea TaxID=77065 RepID=A0A9Q0VWM1_SALPP|nr:hypothetical protein OIU79_028699 [Salix purpurea]
MDAFILSLDFKTGPFNYEKTGATSVSLETEVPPQVQAILECRDAFLVLEVRNSLFSSNPRKFVLEDLQGHLTADKIPACYQSCRNQKSGQEGQKSSHKNICLDNLSERHPVPSRAWRGPSNTNCVKT